MHLAAKGPPKAPKRKTQKRLAKPLLSDSNPEEDEFTTPSQSPLQSPSRDLLHLSPEQHHTFVQATQALLPKVTKNLFTMVARTLDSDEFISQDTLDVMKNKRLPKIRSKDAPIFDGTSDGIKDFIMSLEIIYHTQALTDEAAQVELAAVYAGEKVRKTWFALPEYKAAKWKNFKEAVLSSYNQGKDDEEYNISELEEAVAHYLERPIATKQRWTEFIRDTVHIMRALIREGEVTDKRAVDIIQRVLTEGCWNNVYTDLRTLAREKNTAATAAANANAAQGNQAAGTQGGGGGNQNPPPPAGITTTGAGSSVKIKFNLDEVLEAVSAYFNTGQTYISKLSGNSVSRHLVSPGTRTVKIEELQEQNNALAAIMDLIAIQEKKVDEQEKRHIEERRSWQNFLETQKQNSQSQQARSQGYAANPATMLLQTPMAGPSMHSSTMAPPPHHHQHHGGNGRTGSSLTCYFCEETGHFQVECPKLKNLEKEGWIYRLDQYNKLFRKDGKAIRTKMMAGISPIEQVHAYMREQGVIPNVRTQNLQDEDWYATEDLYFDGKNVFMSIMDDAKRTQPGFD